MLSEFIVSVIKGNADLTPRKREDDSEAPELDREPSQDSEVVEEVPVVHEEL